MRFAGVSASILAVTILAGCGSSSSSPKPRPTPTAAPTASASETPMASATPAASMTATLAATPSASPTVTSVIANLPVWCGNLGSAQSEVNKLNAEMGSNPSVSQLVATLHQLHGLISADAAKATGKVKQYFASLAKAANTAATDANQYTGILAGEEKTLLEDEVRGLGGVWQIVKDYAGCGVITP